MPRLGRGWAAGGPLTPIPTAGLRGRLLLLPRSQGLLHRCNFVTHEQEDWLGGLPPPRPLPWLSPHRDDSSSGVVAAPSSFLGDLENALLLKHNIKSAKEADLISGAGLFANIVSKLNKPSGK